MIHQAYIVVTVPYTPSTEMNVRLNELGFKRDIYKSHHREWRAPLNCDKAADAIAFALQIQATEPPKASAERVSFSSSVIPNTEDRYLLKQAGFRWNPERRMWIANKTEKTIDLIKYLKEIYCK